MKKILACSMALLMIATIILAAGCAKKTTSTTTTSTTSSTTTTVKPINISIPYVAPPNDGKVLVGLPQSVLDQYSNYTAPGIVSQSPWASFQGAPKPWKVYYLGMGVNNAWLDAAAKAFEQDATTYKNAGYISDYVVMSANFDPATQVQQMQTAIEQGANAIFVTPVSADALNGTIEQAYKAGILVIAWGGISSSPYAISLNSNPFSQGAQQAISIAMAATRPINLLEVNGQPGAPSYDMQKKGAELVFAQNPNITIVGAVDGNWAPADAKTATLNWLMTHQSTKVDVVYEAGAMHFGVKSAFEQAGRPPTPITFSYPLQSEIADEYDHINDPNWIIAGSGNPPVPLIDSAFRVMVFTLLGDGPKINMILAWLPRIGRDNIANYYQSSFKASDGDSAPIVNPPPGEMFGKAYLSGLFNKPLTLPVDTIFAFK